MEDQLSFIEGITYKKMFGEYGVFIHHKMVAILADDQLFVKPTETGKIMLKDTVYASPYPGAKLYFLITDVDDKQFLKVLFEQTYEELPLPKKRKRKTGKK